MIGSAVCATYVYPISKLLACLVAEEWWSRYFDPALAFRMVRWQDVVIEQEQLVEVALSMIHAIHLYLRTFAINIHIRRGYTYHRTTLPSLSIENTRKSVCYSLGCSRSAVYLQDKQLQERIMILAANQPLESAA